VVKKKTILVELEMYFADHMEALLVVGHTGAECESDTNPNEPFIRLEYSALHT
jgi:hypothetical protein